MAFLGENPWIFLLLVFGAVVLLTQGLVVPVLGDSAKARRRMNQRLRDIASSVEENPTASLLHSRHRQQMGQMERWLDSLPFAGRWRHLLEQAGLKMPPHRLFIYASTVGICGASVFYMFFHSLPISLVAGLAGSTVPFIRVFHVRRRRLMRFDEQLPDSVDVMVRALKAGHPFTEAMRLVSSEMEAPLGEEFKVTFNDINYGGDVRAAFLRLLSRVPSMTLMAVVTAVLVQRETGGNLAEILSKISAVIRGRFRFQRRLRTLSAEGRLSAWVLTMTPLVLFVLVSIVNPDYMPMLLKSPYADQLIGGSVALMVVGVFWIQRILRIEV